MKGMTNAFFVASSVWIAALCNRTLAARLANFSKNSMSGL
jgi:hypothetical protein